MQATKCKADTHPPTHQKRPTPVSRNQAKKRIFAFCCPSEAKPFMPEAHHTSKTMPFIENHAKLLRILGIPFTPFYAAASQLRNLCYDNVYIKPTSFPDPVISVGNLCVGGSGKTPMVEYLIRLLGDTYKLAVLSRGYGRKSKGNLLVEKGMNVQQTGDEPLQYFLKFHEKLPKRFWVYLAAKRAKGIQEMKSLKPECQIFLLDDAYQHRQVHHSLSILLTEYAKPFFKDHFLPWGNLRESRKQCRRADIIIATKCPPDLSYTQRESFKSSIPDLPDIDHVFFSVIRYEKLQFFDWEKQCLSETSSLPSSSPKDILLVTGIANAKPMSDYLQEQGFRIRKHFDFGDHHAFSQNDLQKIADSYRTLASSIEASAGNEPVIVTTEKDMARLYGHPALPCLKGIPLACLPIRTEFLFNEGKEFDSIVQEHVKRKLGLPPYDK